MSWRERAECRTDNPVDARRMSQIFFPSLGSEKMNLKEEASNDWIYTQAKAICARCEVREECLADAVYHGDMRHGVRGGMSPVERRRHVKRVSRGGNSPYERRRITRTRAKKGAA